MVDGQVLTKLEALIPLVPLHQEEEAEVHRVLPGEPRWYFGDPGLTRGGARDDSRQAERGGVMTASQPATPVTFEVPAGACDCHTHIHGDPAKFPWFTERTYTPEMALPEEMAALHEVPFGLYYGSVDATPLFILLAITS